MVRMWVGVAPTLMCRSHLLGAHNEIHKLYGSLLKHRPITGYIEKNCIEVTSMIEYHSSLVVEMLKREYVRKTPMDFSVQDIAGYLPEHEYNYKIDQEASLKELIRRCPLCRERYDMYRQNK